MNLRWIAVVGLLGCAGAGGCAGDGSYRLHLVFPDAESRTLVSRVELWAIDPTGGTCQELIAGTVDPGDLVVHSWVVLAASGEGGTLGKVPSGEVLFFAQGQSSNDAILLRGCTVVEVEPGATVDVEVSLEWFCHPDPGGEIPRNDRDDDCDGLTDECAADADCDDGSVCTSELCFAGECHNQALVDDSPCSDNDPCTTGDACHGGICSVVPRDCSALNGTCLVGTCNVLTGICEAIPGSDGSGCDDGLYCTEVDACLSGTCRGAPRDCDDADPCTQDNCQEAARACEHLLNPRPGAEGPSGSPSCTNGQDDDCDRLVDALDPNCSPCQQDSDCGDGNPCTTDTCQIGDCLNQVVEDGAPCDDGLYCTVEDRCESGACWSTPRDCSSAGGACLIGVCLEAEARC